MNIKPISTVGKYYILIIQAFKKPQKWKIFKRLLMRELYDLGVDSLGFVIFTSFFIGAIVAIQMYNNFHASSFPIPDYYVAYATKVVLILEFCPTIMSVVLAGKVGSYIASSIGTMRVTEQIDALEVMGVNSVSYLILPKIIATVFFNVVLVMVSIQMGILGGYVVGSVTEKWTTLDYVKGLKIDFPNFFISYCFIKTIVFAFIISTVPSFYGYIVKGGSLEVGRNSTKAVVWSSVLIIIMDLILTQILLD